MSADDRIFEKEGSWCRRLMQFYTGRDRLLYEVVIFTIEKNKVTGYLSTPKSAALFNREMVVTRALVRALPECGLAPQL